MIKTAAGNVIQNPLFGAANRARSDAVRFAAELGLTPIARMRLHAEPPAPVDDVAAKYFTTPARKPYL
jgi:phage terminase small subunit